MHTRVLVVHATKHGATGEIAEKIGDVLRRGGLSVDMLPAGQAGDPNDYDAVIIGSAVYAGRWRKAAAAYLRTWEEALSTRPVWLFSSGPTGEGAPVELTKGWEFPESLQPIAERIRPREIVLFHGALDPTKLSVLERWMIKAVDAPMGDYRDWEAIVAWAGAIVVVLNAVVGERVR